ncbi:MAG: flagellar export chaperone FliS [Deltaproteobacteria bacterium]|nr:flagellar export chaperone FliS [Deltaproteobacteria bacterium]MCW5804113.1 flagellar export chaperone FliS [Deltaproteobacteria bacterium]
MMLSRAANAYRRVDLESAPKTHVLERLFDRFEQDLVAARAAIAAGSIQERANCLDHAHRIVAELSASLDHAAAPELCANLSALYDFVASCLSQANLQMAPAPLDRASKIMRELADAFRQAHAR